MRLFGGDRINNLMEALGIDENTPIENKMLTNSIESAQRKVEERNFGIRRDVLQYDDVMNRQREIIYSQRDKVLDGESVRDSILNMIRESIAANVAQYTAGDETRDSWNLDGRGIITGAGSHRQRFPLHGAGAGGSGSRGSDEHPD